MSSPTGLPEFRFDASQLYREETYSDRAVGTLRRLVPVTAEGVDDPGRPTVYEGQATLMTQAGALPLHFPIEAVTFAEAVAAFPAAAQKALQDMLEEMERMRREQAHSIVVPGRGGPGGGMPGAGGGAPGGGGLIQF